MTRLVLGLLVVLLSASPGAARQDRPFADWAVVVAAGDWRATSGAPTQAFDNARRDVAAALVRAGFDQANVRHYYLRPAERGQPAPDTARDVAAGLHALARTATGGCLFYVTSHGLPQGAVFGPDLMLTPAMAKTLIDQACGTRPTVVVISACYSGVFVPALAAPNRLVMTAARPDRTSFGCGEDDVYPFFDDCFMQGLKSTPDFLALSRFIKACVAKKETELGLKPPSEPQVSTGAELLPLLPFMRFAAT